VLVGLVTAATFLGILPHVRHIGIWEDHFVIGQNLRQTGRLTIDGVPSLFRQPGYPVFVATSLWIADHLSPGRALPGPAASRDKDRDIRVVFVAHCLLAGILGWVAALSASRWCAPWASACIGCMAGLNPYTLALASLVHYHLLFLTLIGGATWLLIRMADRPAPSVAWCLLGGLAWGLTSLVKPVTLLIPVFVGLMGWRLWSWRAALCGTVWFVLGMGLVVAPYMARNYRVGDGMVGVTAQPGFAFWGSSVEPVKEGAPFLVWQPIWWTKGMPIYARVTGSTNYSNATLNAYAVPLNRAFAMEARRNIRQSPGIYLYNVTHNLWSFNTDKLVFWFNSFQSANDAVTPGGTRIGLLWIVGVMVLGSVGLLWAMAAGQRSAWAVGAVFVTLIVSHSISFLTELYTCCKLVPLVLGVALLLERLTALTSSHRRLTWLSPAVAITGVCGAVGALGRVALDCLVRAGVAP
jgi:hypothetical protein